MSLGEDEEAAEAEADGSREQKNTNPTVGSCYSVTMSTNQTHCVKKPCMKVLRVRMLVCDRVVCERVACDRVACKRAKLGVTDLSVKSSVTDFCATGS